MPRILDISLDPEAAIEAAAEAVADGNCIVLPTDTVYGIGANAFDPDAVQRLLHAKQRGRDMPPPVLVADLLALRTLAAELSDLNGAGPNVLAAYLRNVRLSLYEKAQQVFMEAGK